MKKSVAILIIFFSLQISARELNCPHISGEAHACAEENQKVKNAIISLKEYGVVTEKMYSYCLNSIASESETGLQCRTLSLFFKQDGSLIKDVFIDRFIGHQNWRIGTYLSYFLKNGDGSYSRYVDHIQDGSLLVDEHVLSLDQLSEPSVGTFISDNSIEVSFNGNLPEFAAYYWNTSLNLKYYSHTVVLGDNLKVYQVLNTPSVGQYDSEEQWNRFFRREGI